MWMCELPVEWARLCIQYHLDICTSKSVVLTCIIPVEDPSSKEKTKSKERTKALRLLVHVWTKGTRPCGRLGTMGKTKAMRGNQPWGLTKLKSIQKRREVRVGIQESRWNQIQAWRWSRDEAKVTDLLLNPGDESMGWERSGLGQRSLGPMSCFSSGLTV